MRVSTTKIRKYKHSILLAFGIFTVALGLSIFSTVFFPSAAEAFHLPLWVDSCSDNFGYDDCSFAEAAARNKCTADGGGGFVASYSPQNCEGWVCYSGAYLYWCNAPDAQTCVTNPTMDGCACTKTNVCKTDTTTGIYTNGNATCNAPAPAACTSTCTLDTSCAASTCTTSTCTAIATDCSTYSIPGTKSCSIATPELSAGSLTPTTAVAGVSTTFTLPVSNTGAGNAPNFTSLMQRTTTIDANGVAVGPVLDVSTGVTGTFVERTRSLFEKFFLPLAYGATGDPIPANGTGRALFLYTFPPGDAGSTLYLRGCADKSSAADAVGIVAESNENNNCGSWTAVSVTGAAAAAVTSCVPSSASVPANTPVTWSITTSGFSPAPNTYSWSAPGGTPSSGSSASFTTQYAAGGTYSPSITASNGTQSAGPQSCTSVTVTGGACTEAGPVVVTAAPNRVQAGVPTPVTFTSSASNSNGPCTLSGPGIISQAYSPTACTLASKNYTPTLTLTQQSTYTLSCQGGQTGKVIVNIVPKVREF